MPLVRQALYSQNINLYLAPTADGRDSWLSLLRTAAMEGRCFVVSSNMCVRETPAPAPNGHAATSARPDEADETDGITRDAPPPAWTGMMRHRRSSCVTEEGFEIALPGGATPPPSHEPHHRRRRQSIVDQDGNEIVLPCSPSPSSSSKPRGRRQSVIDDDGNEIVLHTSGSGSGSGKPAATTATTTAPPPPKPTPTVTKPPVKTKFTSRGGSSIVSPFGDVLAGPQWEDDTGLIYADVDFADCIRGRLDLDTAGSYSRNDSFKFAVQGLDLTPLPY
jgi:nitrilase